ncbi:hypothetical protein CJF32_00008691 [Rutstroemia sp. NJR-2017a WRK4]|nr:hypothetical protein CJF32_00008691 [Rutstroemia sp. NJR-2017a WRK4]
MDTSQLSQHSRAHEVAGVAILFLVMSTISVMLRVYCRAISIKSFGWDDSAAVAAWFLFALFNTFVLLGVHYGTGQHVWNIPPEHLPKALKWWWCCEAVYVLSNMALKLSIAIFLLRIAVDRIHRIIIYVTVITIELTSFAYFFIFILQCIPSEFFWTQYIGGKGKCVNPKVTVDASYAYSAITCACDWTLGLMPIFLVWNLQMNSRTKISVGIILAVGAIASTATIIRLPYLYELSEVNDFLYATVDVAIWSTCETGIGITVCSLATLRPLFKSFFNRSKLFGSSSRKNTSAGFPDPEGGYIKQKDTGGPLSKHDVKLRSDLPFQAGVTTVIGSGQQKHDDGDSDSSGSERRIIINENPEGDGAGRDSKLGQTRLSFSSKGKWNGGNKKRDGEGDSGSEASEDAAWGLSNMGIKKTTVSTVSSIRMTDMERKP